MEAIADDIAKQVAAFIELTYPDAVTAAPTMLLSVREYAFREILEALANTDADVLLARLEANKKRRQQIRTAYRKIRNQPVTDDVLQDD
jgi:hypothetical protein